MKKPILYILSFSIFVASCATVPYEQTADGLLDPFVSKRYTEVIENFGPPQNVYRYGNDQRILHYDYSETRIRPGMSYTTGDWDDLWAITVTRPPEYYRNEKYIQFYVQSNGQVSHYRHNVTSVYERQIKDKNDNNLVWGILAGCGAFALVGLIAHESSK